MYGKILLFFIVANTALAKPWYEYADNLEVEKIIKEELLPKNLNRRQLAEELYSIAVSIQRELSISHQFCPDCRIKPEKISKEAGKNVIDEWTVYSFKVQKYLAFLIKASDLGHQDAKWDLKTAIEQRLYDIDQDVRYVKKLSDQIYYIHRYLDLKPLDEFTGSNRDQEFLERELEIVDLNKDFFERSLGEILYKKALMRLKDSKEDSYVFFLKKASEYGFILAKKLLVNILHQGTYGVLRDNDLARNLAHEIEVDAILAVMPMLTGIQAEIVNNFSEINDFHHDPVAGSLEVDFMGKMYFFRGAEADMLHKMIIYKYSTLYKGTMEDVD